jgi:hypothetical protein
MVCSGRYPGSELLYREQVEIVGSEMLVVPDATKLPRPINWKEFCGKYATDSTVKELSDLVAGKLRLIFDETKSLPPRKAMQCRLAIMALYLIRLSKEAGNDSWSRREDALWRIVSDWHQWEFDRGQDPKWFVFTFGDVAERTREKISPAAA